MVDFASLKKNRSSSLAVLSKEMDKLSTNKGQSDERYWYPAVDKAGNGFAVVRFLPAPGDEIAPFVRKWEHRFTGAGGSWYIELCLSTVGQPDPVMELNSSLWAMSEDDESPSRKQARAQKRKLGYVSNVLILKDQQNPENEGKVFLFGYGKKIFDKLDAAMHPQYDEEEALNPFDLWDGANFQIKIKTIGEGKNRFRNYDDSKFVTRAPMSKDDAEMERVWKQAYSLQELISADKFKTYDELKAKLDKVLGLGKALEPKAARIEAARRERSETNESPPWQEPKASRAAPAAAPSGPATEDDGDELAYFAKLAAGTEKSDE